MQHWNYVHTKTTVRRNDQWQATASVQIFGNRNILNRRLRRSRYKIKKLLPQSKVVEVKQHDRTVRRITLRRKLYYSSVKRRV